MPWNYKVHFKLHSHKKLPISMGFVFIHYEVLQQLHVKFLKKNFGYVYMDMVRLMGNSTSYLTNGH